MSVKVLKDESNTKNKKRLKESANNLKDILKSTNI